MFVLMSWTLADFIGFVELFEHGLVENVGVGDIHVMGSIESFAYIGFIYVADAC